MLDAISDFIKYMLIEHELLFIIMLTCIFILVLFIIICIFNAIVKYYTSKHVLCDGTDNFNETVDYDAQFDKSKRYDYLDYKDYSSFDSLDYKK